MLVKTKDDLFWYALISVSGTVGGNVFQSSIFVLCVTAPIICFIPLAQLFGMQMLYAQGREKIVIIATSCGAVVNFLLNWILIPSLAEEGAAIATCIAEFLVTAIVIVLGYRYLGSGYLSKQNMHYVIAALLMGVLLSMVVWLIEEELLLSILLGIILSVLFYGSYLVLVKDPFVKEVQSILLRSVNRKQ